MPTLQYFIHYAPAWGIILHYCKYVFSEMLKTTAGSPIWPTIIQPPTYLDHPAVKAYVWKRDFGTLYMGQTALSSKCDALVA